jgi:hypothetical protein
MQFMLDNLERLCYNNPTKPGAGLLPRANSIPLYRIVFFPKQFLPNIGAGYLFRLFFYGTYTHTFPGAVLLLYINTVSPAKNPLSYLFRFFYFLPHGIWWREGALFLVVPLPN